MSNPVSLSFAGDVALLTIDNPPVNACGHAVRQGIVDGLASIRASEARAVVLGCAGRTFVAGADIREFGKPPLEPHLPDVVSALETFDRPIVAALHGTALGGGLELALGCHYRVALSSARLGLPEVNLGLIPGAGGTQRLPRLIGIEAAVDMITSGRPIKAARAKALGLVDFVAETDLQVAAIDFARSADLPAEQSDPSVALNSPQHDDRWFDARAKQLERRARGQQSPLVALQSIRNTLAMPLTEGLAAERELFVKCKSSTQSAALRHIFFAERATAGSVDLSLADAPIRSVGVIGAGTMGIGIALAFINVGFPVTVIEMNQANLERGLQSITKSLAKAVSLGKVSEVERDRRAALVTGSIEYAALADVDLVIEAVFESMDVKHAVFKSLDEHTRPDAILATNTSYLDINQIASSIRDPSRVIGLHFFSPADRMKLLEVVQAEQSSPHALARALKLARKIGKVAVPVGVCFGFAANRSYTAYQGACQHLLLEGVTPRQLDQALTRWGMAMGPCAVLDLSGLDIGYSARAQNPNPPADPTWFAAANALVEAGFLGRKTESGFYLYDDSGERPDNPRALELIATTAQQLGVARKTYDDAAIVAAVMAALHCEGEAILAEGIANQASDLDVIWVNGYGFPRWRGGPMFAAATN